MLFRYRCPCSPCLPFYPCRPQDASRLPPNPTLEHIPDAIAAAAAASGHVSDGGVVVMVVQPGERNAYDQQAGGGVVWGARRDSGARLRERGGPGSGGAGGIGGIA